MIQDVPNTSQPTLCSWIPDKINYYVINPKKQYEHVKSLVCAINYVYLEKCLHVVGRVDGVSGVRNEMN